MKYPVWARPNSKFNFCKDCKAFSSEAAAASAGNEVSFEIFRRQKSL